MLSNCISIWVSLIWLKSIQVTAKESMSIKLTAVNTDYEACYNFSVGDKTKGEFYSPNYPNNYPNQTDCILKIEAPYGQYIKIEFRDRFAMEASPNCEYDRLEIRNGKYGYSDILSVLCGHNFPHEIQSTHNYLWLRFKSDESIEYEGFRGVYTFLNQATTIPPPPACQHNLTGESGRINGTRISEDVIKYSEDYSVPLECIWSITVSPEKKMYINFTDYKLEKPNDCHLNYIDIYGNSLLETSRKERFCGTATEPHKSETNKVHIRLHAKPGALKFAFTILFTAFREPKNPAKCDPKTEFDCDDGTCIHISLKCDGHPNCIYRYDEDKSDCEKDSKSLTSFDSNHMIIILILFFALVIGMCASIVVSCWGKIQERRQRELEYKLRRSREPSVERDLDRTITMTRIEPVLDYPPPLCSGGGKGDGGGGGSLVGSGGGSTGMLIRSNYTKSSANLMDASNPEEDEHGCYVPDVGGYYRKTPTGDHHHHHHHPGSLLDDLGSGGEDGGGGGGRDKYPPENVIRYPVLPNDCPYYHQDSDTGLRSGSESPIPPPPPPPALSHLRSRNTRSTTTLPLDASKLDTPSPPPPPPPHGIGVSSSIVSLDNHHHHHHHAHHSHQSQHHPDCAQHPGFPGHHHDSLPLSSSSSHHRTPNPGDYRSASVGPSHHLHHSSGGGGGGSGGGGSHGEDTEDESDDKVPSSSSRHGRFRAETVIEMSSSSDHTANRPRSFIETRSAPDVIVLR
ncbi:uncharacterized protein LOC128394958 [Panonychus citri]|uniref:uncharacterized protein LOC128394958 n=1 Tax=Panonychus citri TaxID=50023 RepID=UPI0023079259|nr:uncharacterized protein LOC128394958 [Panonychus citri]